MAESEEERGSWAARVRARKWVGLRAGVGRADEMPETTTTPKRIEWSRIAYVVVGCAVVILATAYAAYATRAPCVDGRECRDGFLAWFDGDTTPKSVVVGLATGAAFGFIDTSLLWVALSSLDTLLARLPAAENPNVLASYGNAFSAFVSAFASTFVGQWVSHVYGVDPNTTPLWTSAIGMVLGGLLGTAVAYAVVGGLRRTVDNR